MLTEHSSDPRVNAAVAKLLLSMAPNPYSSEGRTMDDVVDVIEERFGERKARTIRFTVH